MATALNEHIVTSYEDELINLNKAISEMGGMVEQAITDAATALLKKADIKIVGAFAFPPTTSNMTPIVQRVKEIKPDAVISIGYLQDGVLLHKARVAQNYTSPPIWVGGSDAFSNDRLWELLGDKIATAALSGRTYALAQFDRLQRIGCGVRSQPRAAVVAEHHAIEMQPAVLFQTSVCAHRRKAAAAQRR